MQPLFAPRVFHWQMCFALIPAMGAREAAVSALFDGLRHCPLPVSLRCMDILEMPYENLSFRKTANVHDQRSFSAQHPTFCPYPFQ